MNKFTALQNDLDQLKKILVAYSGGVDSSFLLYTAVKTLGRENVLAVTALSRTYPEDELRFAKSFAAKLSAKHVIIRTGELDNRNFSQNPRNRCYYCKDELFRKLSFMAKQRGMALCDATNYSDRHDFRPGRLAAKKWKVISPLEKHRFSKEEIRSLSKRFRLPTWNMPAQACLASRIPYGTDITAGLLERIEKAERGIKKLGFTNVRLRHHNNIARVEIPEADIVKLCKADIRAKVVKIAKKYGWLYICADLEGYRTGSLNEQ